MTGKKLKVKGNNKAKVIDKINSPKKGSLKFVVSNN